MFLKADLTQKEVDPPFNRWCACGHYAPSFFKKDGPHSGLPIRFFLVEGKEINGIYCELCLIIANWNSSINKR